MRFLLAFVAVCLVSLRASADFRPHDGPRPIAVVFYVSRFGDGDQYGLPQVIVYEDGQVLRAKSSREGLQYRHFRLSRAEVTALVEPLRSLATVKESYSVGNPFVTDQPKRLLFFRQGTRTLATSLYGHQETVPPSVPASMRPPAALLQVYRRVSHLDSPQSKPWTPRYLQARLAEASDPKPRAAVPWPSVWPAPTPPRAYRQGSGYVLFLNADHLPVVKRFVPGAGSATAVKYRGKKYYILRTRPVFPGDTDWQKHIAYTRFSAVTPRQRNLPPAGRTALVCAAPSLLSRSPQ